MEKKRFSYVVFMEDMNRSKLLMLLVILMVTALLSHAEVIETPHGKVEFLGLRSMYANQLYQKMCSIDAKNPVCQVVLEKLGFPHAMVNKYIEGKKIFNLVTVVEPQFSAAIRFRPTPQTELPPVDRWSDILNLFEKLEFEYTLAIQSYGSFLKGNTEKLLKTLKRAGFESAIKDIKKIWQTLCKYNKENDRELALLVLLNDKNYKNRIVAGSVLGNFQNFDSTWWALLEALRYPSIRVVNNLHLLMVSLAKEYPREVDWTMMIPSIRAMLDGTNLAAFQSVVKTLVKTKIPSSFAAPLLKNGGILLIDYLKAQRPENRLPIHQLMVQLAGKDLGSAPDAWIEWIKSL